VGKPRVEAAAPEEDDVAPASGNQDAAPAPRPADEDVVGKTAGSDTRTPDAKAGDEPDPAAIAWSLVPGELDVMRDTLVVLSANWPGVDPASYRCLFDPGDRTGTIEGCRVEHRFEGGMADRNVTLSIEHGDKEVFRESVALNLERLPVADIPSGAGQLPQRPDGVRGTRIAFAGLFSEPDDAAVSLLDSAFQAAGAELGFLFFNYEGTGERIESLLERLNASADRTVVPVYCRAPVSGLPPAVRSERLLEHGDNNRVPWQYSFISSGTLYVMLDPRQTSYDLEQEKWMLAALSGGGVAAHRIVVSCSPLEKLTAREISELEPRFRYYEKLLRGDVSLLVSSVYPVFYHARYGDIETLSAGCAVGAPGALLSSANPQPVVLSVVDLVSGKAPEVFAVTPDGANAQVDLPGLPFKVGSYILQM